MIQILITGGTFDKSYNHINGELFFKKTHLPEMLDRSKCRLKVKVKTLMMIDSLQMTKKDIESIINECKKCKSERIVITHGTDTIVNTAGNIAINVGMQPHTYHTNQMGQNYMYPTMPYYIPATKVGERVPPVVNPPQSVYNQYPQTGVAV